MPTSLGKTPTDDNPPNGHPLNIYSLKLLEDKPTPPNANNDVFQYIRSRSYSIADMPIHQPACLYLYQESPNQHRPFLACIHAPGIQICTCCGTPSLPRHRTPFSQPAEPKGASSKRRYLRCYDLGFNHTTPCLRPPLLARYAQRSGNEYLGGAGDTLLLMRMVLVGGLWLSSITGLHC